MITQQPDLQNVVLVAIASAAKRSMESLHRGLALDELGLDSLDFSTILINVEDAVGMEVPAEVLDRLGEIGEISTVGDVMDVLLAWPTEDGTDDLLTEAVVIVDA